MDMSRQRSNDDIYVCGMCIDACFEKRCGDLSLGGFMAVGICMSFLQIV